MDVNGTSAKTATIQVNMSEHMDEYTLQQNERLSYHNNK